MACLDHGSDTVYTVENFVDMCIVFEEIMKPDKDIMNEEAESLRYMNKKFDRERLGCSKSLIIFDRSE